MRNNFRTIFKFSFLRIIKNKTFIILTAIIFLMIALIQGLVLNVGENIIFKAEVGLIFIVTISFFWISFVNITGIITITTIDYKNGIQSLQKRRGVKNSTIFFANFLPLKIVTTSFVLIVFIIYITVTGLSNILLKDVIINNLAIGIFSILAFDLLFFGFISFISIKTKSLKKTLPIAWVIATFSLFFSIFGPIIFALTPGGRYSNIYQVWIHNKYNLQTTQNEENHFLSNLGHSLSYLEELLSENIRKKTEGNCGKTTFQIYLINRKMLSNGLLIEFGELIQEDKFEQALEWYFNQFKTNSEKECLFYNGDLLKEELEKNLFYNFLKAVNLSASGRKVDNFKNSYFYKAKHSNYSKPQQLKEAIDNFTIVSKNNFDINDTELEALLNAIEMSWKFEYAPYSNEGVFNLVDGEELAYGDFFSNYELWIEKTQFSPGSYLFNSIIYGLLTSINRPLYINESDFYWKPYWGYNYVVNPFMLIYEMVFYSGLPNITIDALIQENSPMPTTPFNFMKKDDSDVLVFSGRPFSVWANYLGFVSVGFLFAGLGYLSFIKPRDQNNKTD